MIGSKLKALALRLSASDIKADCDFGDIVEVLRTAEECSSVRYSVDRRENGQTHFLRVGIGDALLCVVFFTTDKYFAVRRGTITRNNVPFSFRWHSELEGFEYEGAEEDREAVYQFLSEVIKGF